MHTAARAGRAKLGTLACWKAWVDALPVISTHQNLLFWLIHCRPAPLHPATAGQGADGQAEHVAPGPGHAQINIEVVHQPGPKLNLAELTVFDTKRQYVHPGVNLFTECGPIPMVRAATVGMDQL